MTLHKAPGLNVILSNAVKVLNDENKKILFNIFSNCFDGDEIIDDWQLGSLKVIPKKGDFTNPNN